MPAHRLSDASTTHAEPCTTPFVTSSPVTTICAAASYRELPPTPADIDSHAAERTVSILSYSAQREPGSGREILGCPNQARSKDQIVKTLGVAARGVVYQAVDAGGRSSPRRCCLGARGRLVALLASAGPNGPSSDIKIARPDFGESPGVPSSSGTVEGMPLKDRPPRRCDPRSSRHRQEGAEGLGANTPNSSFTATSSRRIFFSHGGAVRGWTSDRQALRACRS